VPEGIGGFCRNHPPRVARIDGTPVKANDDKR
jgi:hypothetical protein